MDLQRGSQLVTKDDLSLIATPDATTTFVPVAHYSLANTMLTISQDLLTDFRLIGQSYEIARFGNHLYAHLDFIREAGNGTYFRVAYLNSLDKSTAIKIALGASAIVCSNGMFAGEQTILRRHTANVWSELENLIITSLYRSQKAYEQIVIDSWEMQKRLLSDREAFGILGNLYGNNVLSSRQLSVSFDQWKKPDYQDFEPRNMYSLYMGASHSLKSEPPISKSQAHINLHNAIIDL